jgi:Tfp pilus assembly protein PilF
MKTREPVDALLLKARSLHRAGNKKMAAEVYRAVLHIAPHDLEANFYLGLHVGGNGQHDVSDFERGNSLKADGKLEEAAKCYKRAITLNPDFAEAHNNLGAVLLEQGHHNEAAAAFHRALAINPVYAEALNNLAFGLHKSGNFRRAVEMYRRAVSIKPNYAEAYSNLGVALAGLGSLEEAIAAYQRAIELQPDFAETYHHLGAALCERGSVTKGYSYYLRAAELTYSAYLALPSSPHKKGHDQEQRDHRMMSSASSFESCFHIEGGEKIEGPSMNAERDISAIESAWLQRQPQIVVIDDFLTIDALDRLRRFCWGSTIWRESFDDGYLGSRPESGFACPLLAQIAEELPGTYPAIFSDHPLIYSWSFKYDSRLNGTKIHADFARVNVNFWLTPDDANMDPNSGGLIVWDTATPADWTFDKYNLGEKAIRSFLASKGARSIRIPYRANRAVIFNSDLFHETDKMVFKDGYTNRRINVTFLYGWRQATMGSDIPRS